MANSLRRRLDTDVVDNHSDLVFRVLCQVVLAAVFEFN